MSNDSSHPTRDRRNSLSFTPGSSQLSSYFSQSRAPPSAAATPAYPGPITTAAANANHHRRMSLGGGSPPQVNTSSFGLRRGSVSSISTNESAVDDEGDPSTSPHSPFARRMSWGAKALREVRIPQVAPKTPGSMGSPVVSKGFWMDNTRVHDPMHQQRRQSISTMPAPPAAAPSAKETSEDRFQERMLKGELYMD